LQTPPLSNSNSKIIDQLEVEKTQLQNQKTEIENQVAANQSEKKLKDQSLAQIIEQLKQKDSEIKKLKEDLGDKDKGQKNSPSTPEKDNNKLN
jgi:hypothetical protein